MNAMLETSDTLARGMWDQARRMVGTQLTSKKPIRVHLWIPGDPLTQHRHRAASINGKARMRTDDRTLKNRDSVVNAWDNEMKGGWVQLHEGPVILEVITLHSEPKDCWPGRMCSRIPDTDNQAKLVADALNQVAWKDDRQILRMISEKAYGAMPGTLIRITFLEATEKPLHGRVKNGDNCTEIWEQGTFLGQAVKERGQWWASYPTADGLVTLTSYDGDGRFRTLTMAEAAIKEVQNDA